MMLHYYAPAVWSTYGVPFDRIESLWWDDFLVMCQVIEQERRAAQRERS